MRTPERQPGHVRRTRSAWQRGTSLALAAAFLVASCSDDGGATPTTTPTTTEATGGSTTSTTAPGGDGTGADGNGSNGDGTGNGSLVSPSSLRLSEGHAQTAPADPTPVVDGTPLDDDAIAAVLDRLPEWVAEESLAEPFAWPTQTLPAPIAGNTLHDQFPPADTAPTPDVPTGPLHVLRHQPDGDVALAPFISITFDQPMVPVTTIGQLAGEDVPATITPALPGRWQWIGTRTLRFDYDANAGGLDRLPMATSYTVEVPAGAKSATGGSLADGVSWTFTTPPVTVQSFVPSPDIAIDLTPVFVATFDQRVDPDAVLAVTTVTANDSPAEMRLATAAEIEADPTANATTSSWPDGRWVAFRPVEPFAPNSDVDITIGPDTPSAEGPLTSDESEHFTAFTYRPLEVGAITCGNGTGCRPPSSIEIGVNNPLDPDLFDPAAIRVEPPIDDVVIGTWGSGISIWGNTAGRTTYEVTLPASLTDVFGQQLGEDVTRSITFGDAAPALQPFTQPMITLDPLAELPTISVVSTNHTELRLRAFAVQPSDWGAYSAYFIDRMNGDDPQVPFDQVLDTTVPVDGDQDRATETSIDLSDQLAGAANLVVIVEPTETYGRDSELYWQNRPAIVWVQSTTLGLDAFVDNDEMRVWVTDLASGAPRPGVTVQPLGESTTAVTDADGLARLATTPDGFEALVATSGDEVALLTPGYFYGGGAWGSSPAFDQALYYIIDDRQVYRPGETVSIKGWARRLTTSTNAQVMLLAGGVSVNYTVRDPQGNEIASGAADLSPLGGFDFQFDVPVAANLGVASIEVALTGVAGLPVGGGYHTFQIEEFRRPEFEVDARAESPGPAIAGEPLTVAVDANYYAGGPLGASPVDWQVTTSPATYAPPGWDDFSFGRWTPWWLYGDVRYAVDGPSYYDGFGESDVCCSAPADSDVATFSGTTDAGGTHYLQIDVPRLEGDLAEQPVTVTAQANVTDVNRQSIAATTNVLVHPSSLYVGLAGKRTFVREGEALDIDVIVTDVDGNAVAGVPVHITASRAKSVFRNGSWTDEQVDEQVCDVTSATDPTACHFTAGTGGTYTIAADVTDDAGRVNHSELTRWVSGGDAVPARNVQQEQLTIVPDLDAYAPGTSAQLLIQSPIANGEGLAVVTRNGIASTLRFQVVNGSAILAVPIGDADIPNVGVQIEVIGTSARTADDGTPLADAPPRPAFAAGGIDLPISIASRTLGVEATVASEAVEPGDTTAVDVAVTGADGNPVAGAELAVVVVDEAVLALSNYELQDPLATFYSGLPTYLSASYGRSTIVLTRPDDLLAGRNAGGDEASAATEAPAATTVAGQADVDTAGGAAPMAADDFSTAVAAATGNGTIDVRTNFDALAVFEPEVTTDADGHAHVDVPLPDNLTRYRVMVVAVAGDNRFGSDETNLTARLPLMVRPSAPRFLNFGDVFELPVVVQNQTDAAMDVDVVLQTDNLTITGPAGVRVAVPANDRVEVRFAVAAAQAGTARFRVAVASGDEADAATVELPVYTPATSESFATYGVIDDGVTAQPVVAPTDVIRQFGGLEVTTSSTALQTLTDAVLYLNDYPYRSSDALASRIIAISSLRDVLDAFDAEGLPSPDELNGRVQSDVDALVLLQNGTDGGFGYWRAGASSDPFNSVQATHALVLAQQQGFKVPADSLQRAMSYLHDIEAFIPSWYGESQRVSVSAYALYVRTLAGDRDAEKAQDLYDSHDGELPLDAIAWIWPVVDDGATSAAIETNIANRAVDTAGAATFTNEVDDDDYLVLQSDRRTDGLVLDALIAMRPDSDLIPKVVAGLLGNRNAGRWDGVQENSFILLALHRYFETYEAQTPDFVARVWLGEQYAGEHPFVGRSTDRARLDIPTSVLIDSGDGDLVIQKDGTGRLYYRIGLRTAPADLDLDPLDRGFVVVRTYEAIDDPADVTRDADGTWHIKAGARVRVRLTMVAESQRTHAALIDPLPAGLEILNPDLATSGDVPADPATTSVSPARDWWWTTWFDHQNMRDDRAEAFATLLPAGTYDYSYVATATTPGTFVVPPARAEEMYAPETFGRSGTDTVVVA